MRFRAKVALHGKTATGFEVPAEVVSSLGTHKRPPVRVTIADYTYRSTIATYAGKFMLPLSAQNRAGAGVAAGDEVDVDVELDTEPREVEVPADLATALNGIPGLRQAFDALAFTHRKEYVLAVEDAKTEETRQRRIAKTVGKLQEGGS
jgi:Bacteriocin-protection, YdeI or OmpD-Associated/Domain of unknown function (DUF1905)